MVFRLPVHWTSMIFSCPRTRLRGQHQNCRLVYGQQHRVITRMAGRWTAEQIAATLNRLRLRTGTGRTWNDARVYQVRHRLALPAYEADAQRAATLTLDQAAQQLGASTTVVRKLIEWQYERALRQLYLGNSIKVSEQQLPELWSAHRGVTTILDMPELYDLYVSSGVLGGAQAVGAGKPMIVIDSDLVQRLGPGERRVVIAHELSHILSDHVVYLTTLNILLSVGSSTPFFLGIPFRAVRAVLLSGTARRSSAVTGRRRSRFATRASSAAP